MKKLTPPEIILFDWHATLRTLHDACRKHLDDALKF
jgi:hypothetical protein